MALTLHDVLRAIVSGDRVVLNSSRFAEEGLAAIDAHEQASKPAPAPEPAPAPAPAAPGSVFGGNL